MLVFTSILQNLTWHPIVVIVAAFMVAVLQAVFKDMPSWARVLTVFLLGIICLASLVQTDQDKEDDKNELQSHFEDRQQKFDRSLTKAQETLDSVNKALTNTTTLLTATDMSLKKADQSIQSLMDLNRQTAHLNQMGNAQMRKLQKITDVAGETLVRNIETDSLQKIYAAIRLKTTIDLLGLWGDQIMYDRNPMEDPSEIIKNAKERVVNILSLLASQEENSNLFLNPFLWYHWKKLEERFRSLHYPLAGYGMQDAVSVQDRVYEAWQSFIVMVDAYRQEGPHYPSTFYFPPRDTSFLKALRGIRSEY